MNATVSLDKFGRIVLPKPLRDALGFAPGDQLEVDVEGETVRLRAKRSAPALFKDRGVWVFDSGEPLTEADTNEVLQSVRRQRLATFGDE